MSGFFSKLFGKIETESTESAALEKKASSSDKRSGRREPPTELDWSHAEYIPLPPSPPTWEVDGRDVFHSEYNDPEVGPVIRAGFKGQNLKVLKMAAGLSAEQRQGRVGEEIAKAFRKIIIQRVKNNQLETAAKQCVEMFKLVPKYILGLDQRRFNKILIQMDKAGKKHEFIPVEVLSSSSKPLFVVSGESGWTLEGVHNLKNNERPDPAFNIAAIDISGIWMLDRYGNSVKKPGFKAVLRRVSKFGQVVAEKPLVHDVYRIGTGTPGSNIAIMDSDGDLHIYDALLKSILEVKLKNDSRIVDHFRTIETNYWGDFKTQVRAVDVSPEGERYLFTLADEVWCCSLQGQALWGLVMPLIEGWKRVVRRVENFGVGQEVEEALRLFGLSLPVNPIDIKRKYRSLAFAYHPDRNPNNPIASEQMKALNRAFEVLTGVDPNTLMFEETDMISFVRTNPDHVIEIAGMRIEITVSMGTPQDWVYAASFSATDGCVYVATYSGKVILVSKEGRALIVYDIGTCPSEIIEIDRYSYFLTPTRLYVVEDRNKLAAFLDIFQQGRLVVSPSGFGLLSDKKLQWFTRSGEKIGELESRDPIRAIRSSEDGAIVQTRQNEVLVHGLSI